MAALTVVQVSGLALDKKLAAQFRNARLASNRLSLQQHQPLMVAPIAVLANGQLLDLR